MTVSRLTLITMKVVLVFSVFLITSLDAQIVVVNCKNMYNESCEITVATLELEDKLIPKSDHSKVTTFIIESSIFYVHS